MCINVENSFTYLNAFAFFLVFGATAAVAGDDGAPVTPPTFIAKPHAIHAERADQADEAYRSDTSGYADSAGYAGSAGYAANAGALGGYDLSWVRNNGLYAGQSGYAGSAGYADLANRATRAERAATADVADAARAAVAGSQFLSSLYTRYSIENVGFPDCPPGTWPIVTHTGWDMNNFHYYQYLCLTQR
jgi:hypothetical protein